MSDETEKPPTFDEWLAQMNIKLTVPEILDLMDCAERRRQTVEELLGYPYARKYGWPKADV